MFYEIYYKIIVSIFQNLYKLKNEKEKITMKKY